MEQLSFETVRPVTSKVTAHAHYDRKDTLQYRVRVLFWIAMSNFVIPGQSVRERLPLAQTQPSAVPLYVGQLIETITDTNSTTIAYFQLHIVFWSVICVAFATSACPITRPFEALRLTVRTVVWAASSSPAHDPDDYVPEVARPLRRRSLVSIPETSRAERFRDASSSGAGPILSQPQDHPLQTWVDFSRTSRGHQAVTKYGSPVQDM
jgi:hypothetical protein